MFKRALLILAVNTFGLVLVGCTTNTQPPANSGAEKRSPSSASEKAESSAPVKRERVTLYVRGMTKVQGIT